MCELLRMATDPSKVYSDYNMQVILAGLSPILSQLPKWIELGAYLEFGDNAVRVCQLCHNICEWIYFKLLQFNCDGVELCGRCVEKCKNKMPWKLYVREGLMFFLGSLNAIVSPPISVKSLVVLDTEPSNSAQVTIPLKPSSHKCSFEPCFPCEQLLESCKFETACAFKPLVPTALSEPLHVVPSSEPQFLELNSEQLHLSSCSDGLVFTSSSDLAPSTSKAQEESVTDNMEGCFISLNFKPAVPKLNLELFASNGNPLQFKLHLDTMLLTSSFNPVVSATSAEPVQLSLLSPVLSFSKVVSLLSTSCPESEVSTGSFPLEEGTEPLGFASIAGQVCSLDAVSLPKSSTTLNLKSFLLPSSSGTSLTYPDSGPCELEAELFMPASTRTDRGTSKSGKNVSDGTVVDRLRTIVQKDCRLGKDLFTTGIELADRYNSCYKHETLHVRRVFVAMKMLGYAASKDTMQVQVQKVKRKVKLIYGLTMK